MRTMATRRSRRTTGGVTRADLAPLCAARGSLASGRDEGCLSGDAEGSDWDGERIPRCLVGE